MKVNTQPREKRSKDDGFFLSVHSIFYTIQGEGPFAGTPAVFVRLTGCNLQCPFCDTDYTTGRQRLQFNDIVEKVYELLPPERRTKRNLVVITGGEPFRQNLSYLLDALDLAGSYVQIETNGSLAPSQCDLYETNINKRTGVYVVCSPKTGKVNQGIADIVCAYKYVVQWNDVLDEGDGLPLHPLDHPSSPHVARPQERSRVPHLRQGAARIYLQPTDCQDDAINKKNLHACINLCMKHGYILNLQIHKIIGVE